MDNNKRDPRQSAVSVGNKLKEARAKKALAIEQVQKATRIHSTVLIALEEGRANELLTDTYVRSFLKKYCQFLGLNSAELLKEYFPAYPETPLSNIPPKESALPPQTMIAPKVLYATLMAVSVLILILAVLFIGGRVVSALKKQKPAPPKSAVVLKKGTARGTKISTKKKSATKQNSGTKELIPRSTPLNLVIRVKETVLVQLKKDGILIFDTILARGLTETVTANNSIELMIGKAGALELTLNGRPLVLPANKVRFGLEITRKGVRIK